VPLTLTSISLKVEADYTVVFFAAGSKYAPSWNWVWKAYRSLSRKYRKNLKQLVSSAHFVIGYLLTPDKVHRPFLILLQESVLIPIELSLG